MLAYIPTLILIAILVPIAWIDAQQQIIPNPLNLLIAVSGLLLTYVDYGLDVVPQRMAAVIAVAVFFLGLRKLYSIIRGQTGLGLGDVKFLAAATLWLGPSGLPWLVLFASISGLAWHVVMTIQRGGPASVMQRVAFGPHLAVGFLLAWTWQPQSLL